jgi:hypothetical protein
MDSFSYNSIAHKILIVCLSILYLFPHHSMLKIKENHPSYLSCLSYNFSLNYGEIWAQSNDSLGMVFTWMYLKNCWRKWSLFVFSILFCIFSPPCWNFQKTTLCYDVLAFDFSLKRKESVLKIRVNLICNVLKSFWLVSGPCRNWWPVLSTILQTFCYLTILSFCLLLSQQTRDCTKFSQQFIIVNQRSYQPSYPSLAGLTVDWLEYEIFVTSWDIGFQVIVAPLFQIQHP